MLTQRCCSAVRTYLHLLHLSEISTITHQGATSARSLSMVSRTGRTGACTCGRCTCGRPVVGLSAHVSLVTWLGNGCRGDAFFAPGERPRVTGHARVKTGTEGETERGRVREIALGMGYRLGMLPCGCQNGEGSRRMGVFFERSTAG